MYSLTPVRALRAMVVLALTAGFATHIPAAHADTSPAIAAKPYMGWSSWSMQSSKYPGLNPDGDYSYLTEANVTKQTDALAAKLKKYGYDHVNIDAGWWMDKTWKTGYDQYGRQKADPVRFPSGMKAVADRIHSKGLKAGIYLPAGLEKEPTATARRPSGTPTAAPPPTSSTATCAPPTAGTARTSSTSPSPAPRSTSTPRRS